MGKYDENGADLLAQADYFQAEADKQDSNRTVNKLKERISELEVLNSAYVRDMDALMQEIKDIQAECDLLKSALITICKDTDCLFARQTAQSALNATTASAKAKKIFS